jgi:hypothetical protein
LETEKKERFHGNISHVKFQIMDVISCSNLGSKLYSMVVYNKHRCGWYC